VTTRRAGLGARPRPVAADRRARFAVFWIFAVCGVIAALWSTSLPTINARLNLGETRLGLALLLTGAGAVAVMPSTGRLCDRLGSRRVLRVGAPLSGLVLIGPALAGSFPALLVAAFLLGAGIGSLDVAMNAHAIAVEQRYGRSIMSAFHGFWSVGGVLGSAIIATGLHFRASDPALIIGGAIASALLLAAPGPLLLPDGRGRAARERADPEGTDWGETDRADRGRAGRDRADRERAEVTAHHDSGPEAGEQATTMVPARHLVVLLLGLVASAGFICEGAAYNWAPLHAIKELGAAPATAALAYTVFATALMTGRLTGDRLHRRLGRVRALAWAGSIAVVGYLLVLLAPSLPAGGLQCDYAGWAVTGLGLATVVPAIFSAVGERDAGVGRALSWVAVCAYAGELAGPAVIGPLAGATSLRVAMLVPAALAVFIAVIGPVAVLRAARPAAPRPAALARGGQPS
jgi:MFS family permease